MKNMKETLLRLLILLLGLTIAHLGVTLFLLSDLGADPFNVLVQGLFRLSESTLGWSVLTHGRVHIAVCLLIIIVLLIVDRTYVHLGTLVCMALGGPIIDMFSAWLAPLFALMSSPLARYPMLALGCVILAFGMTMVIRSEAGTGPNDLVAVVLSDKLKKKFSVLRVIVDCSFVFIGMLLGGIFGSGTLICAFLVGPVAGLFLPVNGKFVSFILRRCGVEST